MSYLASAFAALAAVVAFAPSASVIAVDTKPLRETVIPQFQQALPNIPGKYLKVVIVEYPPGAKSDSHFHAPSEFIYAQVLSGSVRSQVEGEPERIYRSGDHWYERPGAHHEVSENASAVEPAKLLAVFVVDSAETLTVPDRHERAPP